MAGRSLSFVTIANCSVPRNIQLPFLYQTQTIQSLQFAEASRFTKKGFNQRRSVASVGGFTGQSQRSSNAPSVDQGKEFSSKESSNPVPSWIPQSYSLPKESQHAQPSDQEQQSSPEDLPSKLFSNLISQPADGNRSSARLPRKMSQFGRDMKGDRDAIPFEKDEDINDIFFPREKGKTGIHVTREKETPSRRPTAKASPTSTITRSERAVFDRMFRDISDSESRKASGEDAPEILYGDKKTDPNKNLASLFDEAIRATQKSDETQENITSQPQKYYEFAVDPLSSPDYGRLDLVSSKPRQLMGETEREIAEHKERTIKRIKAAETDVALWEVLESDVFSLIQIYSERQEEDKERMATKAKQKITRTIKAGRPANVTSKVKKSSPKKKAENTGQTVPDSISSLSTRALTSIVQTHYGDFCLEALRMLRSEFPTSPYTMYLLPHIKRLGPISHVCAASTEFYNELIFLKWHEYNDLHGITDLLLEMANTGVEYNQVTLMLLELLEKARAHAFWTRSELNRKRLWWEMQGNMEAWDKMKGLKAKVGHDVVQVRIREAAERRDMEEEREREAKEEEEEEEEADGKGRFLGGGRPLDTVSRPLTLPSASLQVDA